MTTKPPFCKGCPINHLTEGYVPLQLSSIAPQRELWVGEAAGAEEAEQGLPFVGGAGAWLTSLSKAAKISRAAMSIVNTIGCRPPANVYPTDSKWAWTDKQQAREAVEYCRQHHLAPALQKRQWSKITAFGNHAMKALTGRNGILQWRGSPLPLKGHEEGGPVVMPTLHPAFLMRSPSLFSVVVGDLRKKMVLPPEHYNLFPTLADVEAFTATDFSFDFEWDEWGSITVCGLSDRYYHCIVVPFVAPFINELKRIFENARVLIGHNIIGADISYLEKLRWDISKVELLDTMLLQHLAQPDYRHSLAFCSSIFTNKVFWKGKDTAEEEDSAADEAQEFTVSDGAQWKTWDKADNLPRSLGGYGGCESAEEAFRLYNARDTDATLQCAGPLEAFVKQHQLWDTYRWVSVPAAFICRRMGEEGLKIDTTKLAAIRKDYDDTIEALEAKLPEGLKPFEKPIMRNAPAPPGTYKTKTKKCKGAKKDGTKHDPVDVSFNSPGSNACPTCGRMVDSGPMAKLKIVKVPDVEVVRPWNSSPQVMAYAKSIGCKAIENSKTGNVSADKNARKVWGRNHTEFAIVDQLKINNTLRCSFAKEALLGTDRMFFNLLVHGTSEGRLASSGRRKGIDLNIQNQPKEIRKIYVPDYPGWGILDADVVQGENMLTAWLAKDWERWERLNTPGFDEHSYMASAFFNLPLAEVSKGGGREELRKPGKVINHGRNYGLGEFKTQEYLALQGFYYSISDIKEMINIWKTINKRTAAWQNETIALAQAQSYLRNPFGRCRWFQGRDFATKALAFLPASTLADMVLRMMIALSPEEPRCAEALPHLNIGVIGYLPTPWQLRVQVHDSLVAQGPAELAVQAARTIASVMTQPWPQLDNFHFKVEIKFSESSWGECKLLNYEQPSLQVAA